MQLSFAFTVPAAGFVSRTEPDASASGRFNGLLYDSYSNAWLTTWNEMHGLDFSLRFRAVETAGWDGPPKLVSAIVVSMLTMIFNPGPSAYPAAWFGGSRSRYCVKLSLPPRRKNHSKFQLHSKKLSRFSGLPAGCQRPAFHVDTSEARGLLLSGSRYLEKIDSINIVFPAYIIKVIGKQDAVYEFNAQITAGTQFI